MREYQDIMLLYYGGGVHLDPERARRTRRPSDATGPPRRAQRRRYAAAAAVVVGCALAIAV